MMQRHKEFLEQATAHYTADMLQRGSYSYDDGSGFRGCSVGCHLAHILPHLTAEEISELDNKHKIVADYYEYPEWLARLQDMIFENLPNDDGANWHIQLAEAIASRKGVIDWHEAFRLIYSGVMRVSYRAWDHPVYNGVVAVTDLLERVREESQPEGAGRFSPRRAARSAARFTARVSGRLSRKFAARRVSEPTTFEDIRDAVLSAIRQG